jgi:hypothetical protein
MLAEGPPGRLRDQHAACRLTGYMVLHRDGCRTIREYNQMAQPGGFTEREYIKIYADDIDSLRLWAKANCRKDGSFSSVCGVDKPPVQTSGTWQALTDQSHPANPAGRFTSGVRRKR